MGKTTTEWILKLVDDVTAPMRSVHESSKDASEAARDVADSIEDIHDAGSRMPGTAEKIGAAAFVFNQVSDAVGRMNAEIKNVTGGQIEFESSMAKANTMARLGQEEMAGMTEQIRQLSNEIPSLRPELAAGLYQVISNGVPRDNWLGFLEDSSKAAVGGFADLGQSVKVTSTIIKNYELEWEKAGLIQDKIQKTAELGVTSFGEMGESLPKVAGQAKILGLNIDELFGSFAALTGVSGNTAEIATQLKAIFTALIKPTSEAGQVAEQVGIQFNAAAIQSAGSMQAYFTELKTKVEAYAASTGQLSTELYGRLFGSSEALSAFLVLTGQVADDWKTKSGEIANAAGTIQTAFDIMTDTTAAKTQLMENRVTNFKDSIVEAVSGCLPFITIAGDAITSASSFGFAVYGLSVILKKDLWTGLWTGIKGIGSWVVKCAAGTAASVKFGIAGVASFGSFKAMAVSACRAVSTAIVSIPIIGWIAGIVAALAALAAYFYNTSESFRGFVWGVWDAVKTVFSGIGDYVGEVLGGIWHLLKGVFNPANWFDDSYNFSDGIDRLLNADKEFGEKVGKAFAEGRQKGIDDFREEKAAERKTKNDEFNIVDDPDNLDPDNPLKPSGGGLRLSPPKNPVGAVTLPGSGAKVVNLSGNGISGGTGGGGARNVTMNVTFNQTFHADRNGNITGLAEQVVQKITALLRDATVATT